MKFEELSKKLKSEQTLLQDFRVVSLFVFGSVARGSADTDSDVDLLVEFEGPATFDQYMGLKCRLEDLLRCRVDLVTQGGIRAEIRPFVEQDIRRVA